MTVRFIHLRTSLLAALLFCIALAGCKSKITKGNFDKIQEGMSLKEVEAILGEGKLQGDASLVAAQAGVHLDGGQRGRGQTYVWESGDKKITLIFVDDKVKKPMDWRDR